MYEIDVYGLPGRVDAARLNGSTAVVIDVLRATTVAIHALAAGAKEVVPMLDVEETRRRRETFAPDAVLLGGERGGVTIEGFDLGNSPASYTPQRVGGKTLLFTTTNGTVAMHAAQQGWDSNRASARRNDPRDGRFAPDLACLDEKHQHSTMAATGAEKVFLAGFVNAGAVVEKIRNEHRVMIVCAGTDGVETEEDLLLAGCLTSRLSALSAAPEYRLSGEAERVRKLWEKRPEVPLAELLRESRGGRNLVELGLDADILDAARIDSINVVPRLDGAKFVKG